MRTQQAAADQVCPKIPRDEEWLDGAMSRLEKLLREELTEAIVEVVRPIEAACKRNSEEISELRADQQAFLLRDKSVQAAMRESVDELAQNVSGTAKAQSKAIEGLRDQQETLLQRDSDLYRLQEALEKRLQQQVALGCRESLSTASSACEACEQGLAALKLGLDELRAECASGSVSAGEADIATDGVGARAPWSELQRALLQHVATSRSEIIALAEESAEAIRSKLEEVRTELRQELETERAARVEQLEGLSTTLLVECAVSQAKLEAIHVGDSVLDVSWGGDSSGSDAPEKTSSAHRQAAEATADAQGDIRCRLEAAEVAVVEIWCAQTAAAVAAREDAPPTRLAAAAESAAVLDAQRCAEQADFVRCGPADTVPQAASREAVPEIVS